MGTKQNNNGNAAPKARVDEVKLHWQTDDTPDLSWLDQTDKEMGEGFEAHSAQRKASYGRTWEMVGVWAEALVSYSVGQAGRRIERLSSGGLWGIESDSDASYLKEIEAEQIAELAGHLEVFGISTSASELSAKAEGGI